jgi:hypothetical protein
VSERAPPLHLEEPATKDETEIPIQNKFCRKTLLALYSPVRQVLLFVPLSFPVRDRQLTVHPPAD